MAKEKFIYNTQTLRYEKVVEPISKKLLRGLGFLCAALVTGFLFTIVSHKYFPSPKEKQLSQELTQMSLQYSNLDTELGKMSNVLENIQDRDAQAHRMIFGMDPIDKGVWNGGVGGHDKYEDLVDYPNSTKLLIKTLEKAEKLKRKLIVQSRSLDTIMLEAQKKEEMLAAIPSIKPIREDKLKRNINILSGFGRRVHPVHKVVKMHWGIDFTAPKGTAIQATGNGKVKRVEKRRSGYGHNVIIDHGYGYETLYAHMSKILVKKGQTVKKGEKIGLVGSTGTSTAPHCHYEVKHMGKKVNPIHYCMDGLTPEEYQDLVDASARQNQSFD